jgi:hypothetical protein
MGDTSVAPRYTCLSLQERADGAVAVEFWVAAEDGDIFPSTGCGFAGEHAPGFAIFFEAPFAVAARIEAKALS